MLLLSNKKLACCINLKSVLVNTVTLQRTLFAPGELEGYISIEPSKSTDAANQETSESVNVISVFPRRYPVLRAFTDLVRFYETIYLASTAASNKAILIFLEQIEVPHHAHSEEYTWVYR
jgi:hypothetical protein